MKHNGTAGFLAVALLSSAVMAVATPLNADSQDSTVYYVSTEGNDAWSGTTRSPNPVRSDGPFRTVAAARDAIRGLQSRGPLDKPVVVYLRGGTYFLTEPLEFKPQDSGTPTNPVTYAAYPGEVPVLSGGREIRGWTLAANSEGAVGASKWRADLAEVKDGKWYFHQLFVDGRRRQRARAPNTGFFTVDGQLSEDDPARLKFHESDIQAAWGQGGDAEVVVLSNWEEFRLFIKSVDSATHTATLSSKRTPWGNEKNPRYWVENAAGALDAPGEWYLDRRAGKLLYIPRQDEDPKRSEVIASALPQLIRFEGDAEAHQLVHNITLRGITFAHTDWSVPQAGYLDLQAAYDIPAAVEMVGASSCTIEKCSFTHLGQYAIEIHRGSKRIRIAASEMTDLGAGGVKIGDTDVPKNDTLGTEGNVVEDNHIHDIGIVYPAAVGVWIGQSAHNTIGHNEIDHTFYSGISAGWTWGYGPTAARDNLIEFNLIHDIGRGMLSDMGCIYTLGMQPGTVERGNVCHDVGRNPHGYGGWGIYTDEGSSNILIEDNLVYRAQDGGFHQHYGRENMVQNNIFAFGETAEIRRSRAEAHRSFTFEHNIVYWNEGPLLEGKWDDDKYLLDGNVYFRCDGKPVELMNWPLEEWQKRGQDANSIVANPMFKDPQHDDFRLQPGSPVEKIGFRPFDPAQAGPRKNSGQ